MGAVLSIFSPVDKAQSTKNQALKAKLESQAAVNRQKKLERSEIVQTWNIVFGDEMPKKKKEICQIKNISSRQLWMESLFLFHEIVKLRPTDIFHSPDIYSLKWQPPGIGYRLFVPLDDPQLQEQVLLKLATMSERSRKNVIFFFAPLNPSVPLFAPYIHPSSLVSYRTRNDVLNKFCEQFLAGKISIEEFEHTLTCGHEIWQMTVYNLLPEDEQAFHHYLTDRPPVILNDKDTQKEYLLGKISLAEYTDFKYPDRKKLREIQSRDYPEPYPTAVCVICSKEDAGIIKCQNCSNMVCILCIQTHFLDPATREGSFLLMHRRFCLKLGKLMQIQPAVMQEPGYMRQLRTCSRTAALAALTPTLTAKLTVAEDEEEEEQDEEQLHQAALQLQREREEEEKRLRDCPPALVALQADFKKRIKKYEQQKKVILANQSRIDEEGHTDQFIERHNRMKMEAVEKINKSVMRPASAIKEAVLAMHLEHSSYAKETILEVEELIGAATRLCALTSVKDYHEIEHELVLTEAHRQEAAALLQYSGSFNNNKASSTSHHQIEIIDAIHTHRSDQNDYLAPEHHVVHDEVDAATLGDQTHKSHPSHHSHHSSYVVGVEHHHLMHSADVLQNEDGHDDHHLTNVNIHDTHKES